MSTFLQCSSMCLVPRLLEGPGVYLAVDLSGPLPVL